MSYEEVPYTSFPYAQSHPDRLCAVARLFGLPAPHPETARVLELGCAGGGNLISLAELMPRAELVGVDLGRAHIEEARAAAQALDLTNVRFECRDILELDGTLGTFDYVICHGVYSWVAPEVQAKILELCRDQLTEHGVAYISYNTYPGWHIREAVRHMMRYHAAQFEGPRERVAQSRALVEFLASQTLREPYGQLLHRELEMLASAGDEYLFHEHLEDQNQPLYFHQFAEQLARADLQYLAESDVSMMLSRGLAPEAQQTLERIAPDLLRMEQYLDFVRNRQFRQSLVCHRRAELHRRLTPASVRPFSFGFCGERIAGSPGGTMRFRNLQGLEVSCDRAIAQAVFEALVEAAPGLLDFEALCTRCHARLEREGSPSPAFAQRVAEEVLGAMAQGAVELRVWNLPVATALSPRPRALRFAAYQARRHAWCTNVRHERIDLDVLSRNLLQLLDGTRHRDAILDALVRAVHDGTLQVKVGDAAPHDDEGLREALQEVVTPALRRLLQVSLLLSDDADRRSA